MHVYVGIELSKNTGVHAKRLTLNDWVGIKILTPVLNHQMI